MKKKISLLLLIFVVGGIVLFKDPILAFAADFTQQTPVSDGLGTLVGDVTYDYKILKKGQSYSIHFGSEFYYFNNINYSFRVNGNSVSSSGSVSSMNPIYSSGATTSGATTCYYSSESYPIAYEGNFTFNVPSGAGNYEYWRIVESNHIYSCSGQHYLLNLVLEPVDYKQPTFDLVCNPKEIAVGEESTCSLKAKVITNIQEASFKLDAVGYKIISIQAGSQYKTITNSQGVYTVEEKDNVDDITEETDVELVNFRIKSETTGVSNPQIKIADLSYDDGVNATTSTSTDSDTVTADIIQGSNPSTGLSIIYSSIALIIVVTILGVVSFVISRKKLDSKI